MDPTPEGQTPEEPPEPPDPGPASTRDTPTKRETRVWAYKLINSPKVRERYRKGLIEGTLAPNIELFFLQHAFGKPPDVVEGGGLQPIIFNLPPGAKVPVAIQQNIALQVKTEPAALDAPNAEGEVVVRPQ